MKKIVLNSYPDVCDNSFAIFYELTKQKIPYQYVWLLGKNESSIYIDKKMKRYSIDQSVSIQYIKKNSIKGMWHYFTAKYIFNTHGSFEQFPLLPWQKKINLWHGMPLKKIAAMDKGESALKMDATVASSKEFRTIIKKSFLIPEEKVLPLGLPRNDFFFTDNNELKKELNISHNEAVYIWMPTYRQSMEGDIRLDGESKKTICGFSVEEFKSIDDLLREQNKLLFIKLHPMDILNQQSYDFDFTNIKLMTSSEFLDLSCEVNHFLSLADVLITDYSSVYFDFALLNRPIVIYTDDQESYSNSRGFTSEKIFQIMQQSTVVTSFEKLLVMFSNDITSLKILDESQNRVINEYTLDILESKRTISKTVLEHFGL